VIWLAALLAARLAAATTDAPDESFDAPLQRLYDGATDAALDAFRALSHEFPGDPLPVYFEALALAWKLEQRPRERELDARLLELAELAVARADARLRGRPGDARALFARGAAHGVKSRLHLFRRNRGGAAREAARMRSDLRRVIARDPGHEDARFGLALYDYYADVLPNLLKLLRALMGIPGGNRERGLLGLRRAAQSARWHRSEATAQLYEIGAHYERDPDAALAAVRTLRERHPGSPLWGLKLAEHLSQRLGLYAESVRELEAVAQACRDGHPNYSPRVAVLAVLGRAEALLLDLRFEAARDALDAIPDHDAGLALRRAALLARLSALEADPAARARARARRLAEQGRHDEARAACREALALRPRDLEALLCLAEEHLEAGREEAAGAALIRVVKAQRPDPPSLLPRARLLLARLRQRQGRRPEAVLLYKQILTDPGGDEARRLEAERALIQLEVGPEPPAPPLLEPEHYR
jgi:predicted Zn-dependent protease